MKIVVTHNQHIEEYTDIRSLTFSLYNDIINSEMPVNQFIAEIVTNDTLYERDQIGLIGNNGSAMDGNYFITEAKKVSEGVVRVVGSSVLALLEEVAMPQKMYSGESVETALQETFTAAGVPLALLYVSANVTGEVWNYAPEQTARERFQWICFTQNVFVKTYFNARVEVTPLADIYSATAKLIPKEKVFFYPEVIEGEYVKACEVMEYNIDPNRTTQDSNNIKSVDKYWFVNGTYYVYSTDYRHTPSSYIQQETDGKTPKITKVTLIDFDNAPIVIDKLSKYGQYNLTLDLEVLNSGEYLPGDKVAVEIGDKLYMGWVTYLDFAFGNATKTRMTVSYASAITSSKIVIYKSYLDYEGNLVDFGTDEFLYPRSWVYTITIPPEDILVDGHRYILYPRRGTVSGEADEAIEPESVIYEIAIDWDLETGEMSVYNVESLTEENGVITIG